MVTSPFALVGVVVAGTQVVPPSVDCSQVPKTFQLPEVTFDLNCFTSTVTVQNTARVVNGSGTITFSAGSTYIHGVNGGAIPTATWDVASNCNITGYVNEAGGTSTPTSFQNSLNQSFGNFIWNSTGQTYDYSFGGQFLNVRGNLTVLPTNFL